MYWILKIILVVWDKKVFAATGLLTSGALIGVFAASALYSDKANDELHTEISKDAYYKYDQILWRLDTLAIGQNKFERDLEKLDRRIWEIHRAQNEGK